MDVECGVVVIEILLFVVWWVVFFFEWLDGFFVFDCVCVFVLILL